MASNLTSVIVPIVLGVLTLLGGIIVARIVKPSDLMSENRSLRVDLGATDEKVDKLRTAIDNLTRQYNRERDILGRGFTAVNRKLERMQANCTGGHEPAIIDPVDEADIAAATKLLEEQK